MIGMRQALNWWDWLVSIIWASIVQMQTSIFVLKGSWNWDYYFFYLEVSYFSGFFRWRAKQNLDFSFLMLYAQDKGDYYVQVSEHNCSKSIKDQVCWDVMDKFSADQINLVLKKNVLKQIDYLRNVPRIIDQMSFPFVLQLEDDVVAKDGYYSDMKTYTIREASEDWLYLEFSQLGFIGVYFWRAVVLSWRFRDNVHFPGKLFRTRDLPMIAEFFLMFHRDKPVDWLLDHILWVKACHPEKDKVSAELKLPTSNHRFTHVYISVLFGYFVFTIRWSYDIISQWNIT